MERLRDSWLAQIIREHEWLMKNVLPAGLPPAGTTFSGFVKRLPDPNSLGERSMLRSFLVDVCLQWGEMSHRAYHRSARAADRCVFKPHAVAIEGWRDSLIDPKVALIRWAVVYARDFDRSHPRGRAMRLRDHLDVHFAKPTRVDAFAAECHTSVRSLQRDFQVLTGMRVHDYLAKKRVDAACELLRNTDDKVETIASAVGWSSRKNLNRALARHIGLRPCEIRLPRRVSRPAFTALPATNQPRTKNHQPRTMNHEPRTTNRI